MLFYLLFSIQIDAMTVDHSFLIFARCLCVYSLQAAVMRKVITSQAGGRTDVMGLAMALRATRLQHAARFPVHVKQQVRWKNERCIWK
jgi:hypothetical protein